MTTMRRQLTRRQLLALGLPLKAGGMTTICRQLTRKQFLALALPPKAGAE